jgi:hypothetical protein
MIPTTALLQTAAATEVFMDPASGNQVIQVSEPAGGWHWATTSKKGRSLLWTEQSSRRWVKVARWVAWMT